MSILIIGLFFWSNLAQTEYKNLISLATLLLAGLTALCCAILYFIKAEKLYTWFGLTVYALSLSTFALLIIGSGFTYSPFITLWTLAGIFSGIFGLIGVGLISLADLAFLAYLLFSGKLTVQAITILILCAALPVIASGFMFWKETDKASEKRPSPQDLPTNHTELSEVASKSEVVINAIGDGVIAIDSKGLIQLINPAAENLLGWNASDALGLSYRSVLKLVDKTDQPLKDALDPVQQVLNNNQEARNNDLSMTTNSGKKIMTSLVVSPVGDVGSGVIVVFGDITSEKQAEREQAEFISTASHEMRTPVASIEGYLGLALNPATAQVDARARDYINKAHESAQHLGRLFQDLLDIAKSEDGRMTNSPKVTNLVPFLHDIVQGLQPRAAEKNLRLIYRPMPDDPNIRTVAPSYLVNLDNDHIREVVSNLVENAIKYTLQGDVTVDIDGDEEHITVSVKDTGIGIPAEDMTHLFQKFYRVDDQNTRQIGGTGLGLFLSRKLTEMMGGRIWAESEYGKGSTFFLEMPRVSTADAELLKQQEAISSQINAAQTAANAPKPIAIPSSPSATAGPTPIPMPNNPKTMEPVVSSSVNNVPRGQALTPEQKAAYIAKQQQLAQSIARVQPQLENRGAVTIPERDLR